MDYNLKALSDYHDRPDPIGMEVDDDCNRFPDQGEDCPRGYKVSPCNGFMVEDDDGYVVCETCGEHI